MCLVDNKRFRFTFKRIPVYKVVCESSDGNLYTPFQCARIVKKMHGNITEHPHEYIENEYSFDNGFIHAYLNKDSTQYLIKDLDAWHPYGQKIIEGYIPAFTRYAIDTCSPYPLSVDSICARRMVFPNV